MFLSLLYVNVGSDPDRDQPGRRWLRDVYRVHQRLWMAFPDSKRREEDPFFLGAWDESSTAVPKPPRRESGFLFRIERDGLPRILVQSAQQPYWDYAFQNAPYLLASDPDHRPRVRAFDPAPRVDQRCRFRLQANVVSSKNVVRPNGKMRTTRAGLTIPCRRRTEIPIHPDPMPDPPPDDPVERKELLLARWEPWRKWLEHLGSGNGFHVEREPPLLMEAVHTFVRNPGKDGGGSNEAVPTAKRYNAGLFDGVLVCTDQDRLRNAVINGLGHAKAYGFGLLSVAPIGS